MRAACQVAVNCPRTFFPLVPYHYYSLLPLPLRLSPSPRVAALLRCSHQTATFIPSTTAAAATAASTTPSTTATTTSNLLLRRSYHHTLSHPSAVATPTQSQMYAPEGPKKAARAAAGVPRPSSSVVLISPTNQVLLLHRVKTSSSFPSAHVFPGGNLAPEHDGPVPGPDDPARHQDSAAYRMAAIRETFEESGILLARDVNRNQKQDNASAATTLVHVNAEEREKARREIHSGKTMFPDWLKKVGAEADIDGLIPFTRWITPPAVPRRFTTQMYLYFLPLASPGSTAPAATGSDGLSLLSPSDAEAIIPTPDGGVEHTTARFLPASTWLSLARRNDIILFPPQFFLLYLIAPFLNSPERATITSPDSSPEELQKQRDALIDFIQRSDESPTWTEKCISPKVVRELSGKNRPDGRTLLDLAHPGDEVRKLEGGESRSGTKDFVVLLRQQREGPRDVEVVKREELEVPASQARL